MPIGYILLIVVALLIVFGVAQRVLDRLRLTDRQALLFVAAIFIGGLIPDIRLGRVTVNIGGALVPLALCVYLFVKADTAKERWRSILAAVLSAAAVYGVGRLWPSEPSTMPFEVNYLYGLVAGFIAYVFGRSRRGAFIGGVVGVLLADAFQGIMNSYNGLTATPINFGGGGALDVVVLSGLIAVLLAEIIGEIRERMQGGSAKRDELEFDDGEFVPAKQGGPNDDEE